MLKEALEYCKQGWSVIPCKGKNAGGYLDSWKEFQEKPASEEQIIEWWERWPLANIGVVLGGVSDIIDLEMECYKEEGCRFYKGHQEELEGYPFFLSGKGSIHVIFKYPDNGIPSRKYPWGEIRSNGNVSIFPPSIHPETGKPYEWPKNGNYNLSEPPQWVIDLALDGYKGLQDMEVDLSNLEEVDLKKLKLSRKIRKLIEQGFTHQSGYVSRSEADQAVIVALLQAGATDGQIKYTFVTSPIGEKYREKRRSGDQYLSRSIAKAKAYLELIVDKSSRKIVSAKRSEFKGWERKEKITESVLTTLREEGFFIETTAPQERFYFHNKLETLFPLDHFNFQALVHSKFGVNPSEILFSHIMAELHTYAHVNGERAVVHRFCYYDKNSNVLYISNFNGKFYRLDGKDISLLPNGSDGVFFNDDMSCIPFEPIEGSAGLLDNLIFSKINFTESKQVRLSPNDQRFLFKLWFYTLFFESELPTKPILCLLGEKGSGKTSTLRWILRLLFGENADVVSVSKDKEDAFISATCSNYLLVLDNLDTRIPWLNDQLAEAATGHNITLRKLYTTNETINFKPRCFLAINSRTPHFKRDDVVDRLLLLKVNRLKDFSPEGDFFSSLDENRNRMWGELLYDLNIIVRNLKTGRKFTGSFRMADWANLAYKIACIDDQGKKLKGILDTMNKEKSDFLLEDDSFFEALMIWLDNKENHGKKIPPNQLFEELKSIAEKNAINFNFKSARSMAMHMTAIASDLNEFIKADFETDRRNRRRYFFNLVEEEK